MKLFAEIRANGLPSHTCTPISLFFLSCTSVLDQVKTLRWGNWSPSCHIKRKHWTQCFIQLLLFFLSCTFKKTLPVRLLVIVSSLLYSHYILLFFCPDNLYKHKKTTCEHRDRRREIAAFLRHRLCLWTIITHRLVPSVKKARGKALNQNWLHLRLKWNNAATYCCVIISSLSSFVPDLLLLLA